MREIDIRLAFDVVKMPSRIRSRPPRAGISESDDGPAAAVPVEAKAQQPPWLHFDTVNRDPEGAAVAPGPAPDAIRLEA